MKNSDPSPNSTGVMMINLLKDMDAFNHNKNPYTFFPPRNPVPIHYYRF